MATFYISFATDDKFLGGLLVKDVPDFKGAHQKSWDLHQNPGDCEAKFHEMDLHSTLLIPERYFNRLLSREEIKQMDEVMAKIYQAQPKS